jgi:hypothetical protein
MNNNSIRSIISGLRLPSRDSLTLQDMSNVEETTPLPFLLYDSDPLSVAEVFLRFPFTEVKLYTLVALFRV